MQPFGAMSQPIHNHGHVILEDMMGNDLAIVNAARVSFNEQEKEMTARNKGLINFLMRERHGTPFEMVELKFDIKAPIFVFREWHRHRTASINEWSGRYSKMVPEFYVPDRDDIREQVGKPGAYSFARIEDDVKADDVRFAIKYSAEQAWDAYERMLSWGVAKEQARLTLPVNLYSRMKWKVNLRNLMGFLALRKHPQAMKEIRDYATVIEDMALEALPVSMSAFIVHGRSKP